jgi:hypothetical protein
MPAIMEYFGNKYIITVPCESRPINVRFESQRNSHFRYLAHWQLSRLSETLLAKISERSRGYASALSSG